MTDEMLYALEQQDEDYFPEDDSYDELPPSVPIRYIPIDLNDLPF